MSTIVHLREGGGQNWVKPGPRSCWMTPNHKHNSQCNEDWLHYLIFALLKTYYTYSSGPNGHVHLHIFTQKIPPTCIFWHNKIWNLPTNMHFSYKKWTKFHTKTYIPDHKLIRANRVKRLCIFSVHTYSYQYRHQSLIFEINPTY